MDWPTLLCSLPSPHFTPAHQMYLPACSPPRRASPLPPSSPPTCRCHTAGACQTALPAPACRTPATGGVRQEVQWGVLATVRQAAVAAAIMASRGAAEKRDLSSICLIAGIMPSSAAPSSYHHRRSPLRPPLTAPSTYCSAAPPPCLLPQCSRHPEGHFRPARSIGVQLIAGVVRVARLSPHTVGCHSCLLLAGKRS
jgi:hypothetical protein